MHLRVYFRFWHNFYLLPLLAVHSVSGTFWQFVCCSQCRRVEWFLRESVMRSNCAPLCRLVHFARLLCIHERWDYLNRNYTNVERNTPEGSFTPCAVGVSVVIII